MMVAEVAGGNTGEVEPLGGTALASSSGHGEVVLASETTTTCTWWSRRHRSTAVWSEVAGSGEALNSRRPEPAVPDL